ncbi:hypothetical protein ACLHDG_09010 [Sulfurovum sp. CS9]|uniref:hypothetical protein n=1 Tax=Sulfurovum sp. CS9 TaxID=3391146 RepID=UPI0039E7CC48
MHKQDMIAREIAKDIPRYLTMRVVDVQEEIGIKLRDEFAKNKWTNKDMVVYGTLLAMARAMN